MITTKEQERKALDKIRKIIAELGEDSYVAAAFEGCCETAQINIDNDWACSLQQEIDANEKQISNLRLENSKLRTELEAEKIFHKQALENLQTASSNCADYKDKIQQLNIEVNRLKGELDNVTLIEETNRSYYKDLLAMKDDEIIRLKAKLYDLTIGE